MHSGNSVYTLYVIHIYIITYISIYTPNKLLK